MIIGWLCFIIATLLLLQVFGLWLFGDVAMAFEAYMHIAWGWELHQKKKKVGFSNKNCRSNKNPVSESVQEQW